MAKKAAKPRHVEPEDESQETPEPEEKVVPPKAKREAKSKTDAVKQALAAGFEGPQEGTAYIRQEFGIEIAPQHFSAVKSQLKKREAGTEPKSKPGRKPKAIEGYLAPPSKRQPVGEETDLLAAMEAMKPLVEALGAEKVKRIADLLS
jgi:hypothetical protein